MGRPVVAIVSDDDVSLALIHLNLARRGYAVVVALVCHVEEGWQPLRSPGLLIVDLGVPEPACWEQAAWLRERDWAYQARLIVLNHCWPEAEWLDRLGAYRHLRKPFAVDDLVTAVEEALATVC
jgi:DNA-binding response OmpR family regulator